MPPHWLFLSLPRERDGRCSAKAAALPFDPFQPFLLKHPEALAGKAQAHALALKTRRFEGDPPQGSDSLRRLLRLAENNGNVGVEWHNAAEIESSDEGLQ